MNNDLVYPEEKSHTHKATLTVCSDGPKGMISLKINWDPEITGSTVEELGYLPAAYQFIQDFIVPAINEAYMEWEVKPMMNLQPASEKRN